MSVPLAAAAHADGFSAALLEYDTPHTMFRVLPLNLQPIVKNAVKHGSAPYAGAFHISVRTRKTERGSGWRSCAAPRLRGKGDGSGPRTAPANKRAPAV